MPVTTLLILITSVVWIIFDIYIVLKKGNDATISAVITKQAKSSLPLVFAAGFLMGHWFW